jgi:tetratricopeptide (TPR) repeat protein
LGKRCYELLQANEPAAALQCLDEAIEALRPLADAGIERAMVLLGESLTNKGAMTGLLPLLEEAESFLRPSVERRDSSRCCLFWMSIHDNRLKLLLRSDRAREASETLSIMLAFLDEQMREGRGEEWCLPQENILLDTACVLGASGQQLRDSGRPEEALVCSTRAAEVFSKLFPEACSGEWLEKWARCLLDHAANLMTLGRPRDAIRTCDETTVMFKRLIEEQTRSGAAIEARETARLLCRNLTNKGFALRGEGRLPESLASLDDALAHLPVMDGYHPELILERAMIEMNKALALMQWGQVSGAIDSYDKVIHALLPIAEQPCPPDLVVLLARAMINKTATLVQSNRIGEASTWADQVDSKK